MNFEIGTSVRFKSGGPVMTVLGGLSDVVTAGWFVKDKYEVASFPEDALVMASNESDG